MSAQVAMGSGDIALGAEGAIRTAGAAESGLVEDCRRGDPVAFARLVSLHERMVYNLAARLLGDAEEARDLSQEVFLLVYRTLGKFQGRSSLRTWIYRIVVNQCRNRQRWWRRRRRERSCPIEDVSAADEVRMAAAAEARSPFDEMARRERSALVQAALGRLSFDHRAVLLLREVEGLSCDEIAATLGVATGTVKSRLARARDGLRLALAPEAGP